MLIVKVERDCPAQPGQRQLLAEPRGEVVAVDGVAGGVQDELVLLCGDRVRYWVVGVGFFLVILWFLGCSRGEEESGDFFRRPDHVFQQSSGREAKALCLNGIRLIRIH